MDLKVEYKCEGMCLFVDFWKLMGEWVIDLIF